MMSKQTLYRQKERAKTDAMRLPAADPGFCGEVALLTGGIDRHYAVGLATGLMDRGMAVDVIGSHEVDGPEFRGNSSAYFLNFHGSHQPATLLRKIKQTALLYARLFKYAFSARPKIFHILWNNKFPVFDRTVLALIYKIAGRRVVFTAHNVNAGRRDKSDSWLNRITLRCQYRLVDHIFVHTEQMKSEFLRDFGVESNKVTIIPYGINNAVPDTELTKDDARRILGLNHREKVILFFGAIRPYKGLEYLVDAFRQIAGSDDYRLIIAGEQKKGHEDYWRAIESSIKRDEHCQRFLLKIEFVLDEETELYFKAADVTVLPYTEIFQSGVLFLAYAYGLPVIASDVGSFREDILEGRTGLICKSLDSTDLAATIEQYFHSDLYKELDSRRPAIQKWAFSNHSWKAVAEITEQVYAGLLDPIK